MDDILQAIWGILTSGYALIAYIVVFLVVVVFLVISLMINEMRPPKVIASNKFDKKLGDSLSGAEASEAIGSKPEEPLEKTEAKSEEKDKEKTEESDEESDENEDEYESGNRFSGLNKLDEQKEILGDKKYDETVMLKTFCEEFRNFAADRLRLYYDIQDIRKFVAGLTVTHIMILQGMSGTGKTSLAYAFGEFLDNSTTLIPVQPMWKERTDLIGYYNEFTKRFNETTLLKKMYEANYSKAVYITILDEMNIARVEYYFAEFLSLLEMPEAEKRELDVVSDTWETDPEQLIDGKIKLPPNMWFIGTANNDDSTFAISDKVYDRAMVLNLDRKSEVFGTNGSRRIKISAERFEKLAEEARQEYGITSRNMKRLSKLDKYMIEKFHITFGNRIMKQIKTYIPVYIACGGDELDALDDIMSKKVLRKLESQNPIYIRNVAEDFCSYLDELFGEDRMPECKDVIRRLEQNA